MELIDFMREDRVVVKERRRLFRRRDQPDCHLGDGLVTLLYKKESHIKSKKRVVGRGKVVGAKGGI